MKRLIKALTLACAMGPCAQPGLAGPTPSQDDVLQAELLPGYALDGGGQMAGLALRLAPGWKTYWRAPGEAGIPPVFDWSASQNVASVRVHWPGPAVFDANGMQVIGYHDGVVLPLEVTPRDPARSMVLVGRVDLGVCKDICMPARLQLSADLGQSGASAAVRAALAARPGREGQARCTITPGEEGLMLEARIALPRLGAGEVVAIEVGDPDLWVEPAQVLREGGVLSARAALLSPSANVAGLDRSRIVLTVLAEGRAREIIGCPAP